MAACSLDARNVPGLPGIPPIEHDKAWAIVEELCVKVIDEVRGAEDAHTHYHTDDATSDFMSTAAASLTTPLRSPRRFTSRALRSREGRFEFGRVGPSRSRRQVILSKNGAVVRRSSHGFLFWPGVYWRFLRHLPHLSAFFLPRVTP